MVRIPKAQPHSEAAAVRFGRSSGFGMFKETSSDTVSSTLKDYGWDEQSSGEFTHFDYPDQTLVVIENSKLDHIYMGKHMGTYDTFSEAVQAVRNVP